MGVEFPTVLQWSNFVTVIEKGKLIGAFGNSVLYAFASTIIGVTVAALAAYVLSRNRTRFNQFIYFFLIMGIAMSSSYVVVMSTVAKWHKKPGLALGIAAAGIGLSSILFP